MPYVDLFFDDYTPDMGGMPVNAGRSVYLVDAAQVYRTPNGYRALPTFATVTSPATVGGGAVLHSAYAIARQNDVDIFVASSTNIYRTDNIGQSWSTVSRATAYATTAAWAFAEYDDYVFAAGYTPGGAGVNPIQYATLGGSFTDVSGTISPAVSVARVRDHMVYATQAGVRWSAIGDPLNYPTLGSATAIATQSGSYSVPTQFGRATKVVGGEKFGLIFCQSGIVRMTYVGGSVVYEFDWVSSKVGTESYSRDHVIEVDGRYYWTNREGVWVSDGYEVRSLSDGRTTEALFIDSLSHPDAIPTSIGFHVAYDSSRQQIIWRFGSNALVYSIQSDTLVFHDGGDINAIFSGRNTNTTDGKSVVYTIASNGSLMQLTAQGNRSVGMQTAFIEFDPGYRVQLEGAHLLGAAHSTPTIGFKASDDYESISMVQTGFTTMTAPARDIKFTARDTARFFAFRISGNQGNAGLMSGLRVYYKRSQGA